LLYSPHPYPTLLLLHDGALVDVVAVVFFTPAITYTGFHSLFLFDSMPRLFFSHDVFLPRCCFFSWFPWPKHLIYACQRHRVRLHTREGQNETSTIGWEVAGFFCRKHTGRWRSSSIFFLYFFVEKSFEHLSLMNPKGLFPSFLSRSFANIEGEGSGGWKDRNGQTTHKHTQWTELGNNKNSHDRKGQTHTADGSPNQPKWNINRSNRNPICGPSTLLF